MTSRHMEYRLNFAPPILVLSLMDFLTPKILVVFEPLTYLKRITNDSQIIHILVLFSLDVTFFLDFPSFEITHTLHTR